jgi:glycosyltransferase involved in cell wall biosynthesis
VVIPCYNQAHFLGEAIESVLEQTYPHYEIVVVDDGATDNTSEVASRYPGKVRLIRQENRGLSGARNTGIRHSEGEYVVFLDADDRLLPGALQAGLGCFRQQPECAFVSGHCRFIWADGSFLMETRPPPIRSDIYLTILNRSHFIIPGAVMYQRSVFDTVGWFDPAVNAAADYDLYLRIARAFPVYYHGEVVLEYRRHDTNMTGNPGRMLKATIDVLRSQREYARRDELYWEAYKVGVRKGQEEYGLPLAESIQTFTRKGAWKDAIQDVFFLLRYYPRGIGMLLLNEQQMERRKLARRLQTRRRELEAHEQHLKDFEEGIQEKRLESDSLVGERQKVQQLKKRIRRLERRVRDIDRRTQNRVHVRVVNYLMRVVGRLRAKLPGR